jgi:hypothetical protein
MREPAGDSTGFGLLAAGLSVAMLEADGNSTPLSRIDAVGVSVMVGGTGVTVGRGVSAAHAASEIPNASISISSFISFISLTGTAPYSAEVIERLLTFFSVIATQQSLGSSPFSYLQINQTLTCHAGVEDVRKQETSPKAGCDVLNAELGEGLRANGTAWRSNQAMTNVNLDM